MERKAVTLHPDEQARELAQQLCSHVNGQYMDPNGIAMIAALLARVRLVEAEWWAENPKMCSAEELNCSECNIKRERLAGLRQAAGEGTKP